jgi:outer membrane protein OmpA-like peptidoglycan-associated protein
MAASFFEQVKALVTPEAVDRISSNLGETPQGTERALTGGAIPAVLGGFVQQFGSGAGPARLMGLIKQHDPDGRLLDTVSSASPAQAGAVVQNTGQNVVGALFGQRGDNVAGVVAEHAGIKKTSAMSLLPIAATMIMGFLGQKVLRGGLDAAGLGTLLNGARGELGRIAPPGLTKAMGVSSFAEPSGTYAASAAAPTHDTIYHDTVRREAEVGGIRRWLPWLIGALVVLGVLSWLLSLRRPHPIQVTTVHPTVQVPTLPRVTPPTVPRVAVPTPNIPAPSAPVQLPNGAQLNLAPNSLAYGLANYLGDNNAPAPRRFTFENLRFPTAEAGLAPTSQAMLNDVAAILRAYPNVNIRVEGFTDNTGSPGINTRLSQQRAESVKSALVSRGIDQNRVQAQGFGPTHPVASNATPQGRAQNRRTDLVVVNR